MKTYPELKAKLSDLTSAEAKIKMLWMWAKQEVLNLNDFKKLFYEISREEQIEKYNSTITPNMLIAMEFGYKQCEKGNNLDYAQIELLKTIDNKH